MIDILLHLKIMLDGIIIDYSSFKLMKCLCLNCKYINDIKIYNVNIKVN